MIKTSKDFIIINQKEKGKNKRIPLAIKMFCCLLLACLYLQFKCVGAKKRKISYCVAVGYPEALDLPTAGSFWEAGRLPLFPSLRGRPNHVKSLWSCLHEPQNSEQWFWTTNRSDTKSSACAQQIHFDRLAVHGPVHQHQPCPGSKPLGLLSSRDKAGGAGDRQSSPAPVFGQFWLITFLHCIPQQSNLHRAAWSLIPRR